MTRSLCPAPNAITSPARQFGTAAWSVGGSAGVLVLEPTAHAHVLEETHLPRHLGREPADFCLAASRLASGPAGSLVGRSPCCSIPARMTAKNPLFAGFPVVKCDTQSAIRARGRLKMLSALNRCGYVYKEGGRTAVVPIGGTSGRRRPTPRANVGRGIAPTSIPRRLRRRTKREVVPNA
jgi:hypothetical protein